MTNNLGRTLVAQGQGSNVFTAINDSDGVLDAAIAGATSVLVDSSNAVTISDIDWLNQTVMLTEDSPAPTGEIVVTLPTTVRGVVSLVNKTSQTAKASISGQSAAALVIRPDALALISSDGFDARSDSGGRPYDIALKFASTPTASQIIGADIMVRPVRFEADFAGSYGHVGTVPASPPYVIAVRVNNAEIGTITIGGGSPSSDFVFATTDHAAKDLAAGDLLEFVAPSSADSDIAYIVATLAGLA